MSKKKNKSTDELLNYFHKKLSHDEIHNKNTINKIKFNRALAFKDFILHLFQLIEDTYLNTDHLNYYEYQKQHFDWCWNRTVECFNNEGIAISYNGEHYNYFLDYLIDCFYRPQNSLDEMRKLKNFWGKIMTLGNQKSQSEYDIFVDTYFIINNHLKIYS